jgi:RNA polymerase sigma factor (sigma-70 family)
MSQAGTANIMMTMRTNEEWIQHITERNPIVMTELWSMLIQWGLTSAYKRQLPEDLGRDAAVQAFVRITSNLDAFSGSGAFVGWCRVIVVREVLRLLESHQKQVVTLEDSTTALDALTVDDAPLQVDQTRVRDRLQPCLDTLKQPEQQVIEGFYYQEQTPQWLADLMKIQVNHVHQLLHRARKKLRSCLQQAGFAEVDDLLSV